MSKSFAIMAMCSLIPKLTILTDSSSIVLTSIACFSGGSKVSAATIGFLIPSRAALLRTAVASSPSISAMMCVSVVAYSERTTLSLYAFITSLIHTSNFCVYELYLRSLAKP